MELRVTSQEVFSYVGTNRVKIVMVGNYEVDITMATVILMNAWAISDGGPEDIRIVGFEDGWLVIEGAESFTLDDLADHIGVTIGDVIVNVVDGEPSK